MDVYPLLFEPILKERVWGGRALETRFARPLPRDARIGESWELVDRPPDSSTVSNGPLEGRTLHELCAEFGLRFLGRNAPTPDRFPLIVKLLDPNDRLSVQVHPTASYVDNHPEAEAPKSEAWYVVDAKPGARIIQGLRPDVTLEDLRGAAGSSDLEGLLQRVDVKAREFYCIPAGLVHALLPGSLIVEIQQNSDTTFRIYDWGRTGLDGKPRQLHVAQALESAATFLKDPALGRFERLEACAPATGVEMTGGLECPSFRIEELRLGAGEASIPLDPASCTILVAVEGEAMARCLGGASVETMIDEGTTALVPAGVSGLQIVTERGATVLKTTLPRPNRPLPPATRG